MSGHDYETCLSENEALVTDNHWAYRKRRSTELLLIHLTETWRQAIDNKLVVGAVLIDFQKAFDCVSRSILLHKLEYNFGITGNLLAWRRGYLSKREQYTVINGVPSENTKVAHGIPQGFVLGPILLRHQHRFNAQRFETYMKNSISRWGSIVWNILEPSTASARDYAKRAKKSHALGDLNFNEESPQMGRPQIDRDFAFHWPYSYLLLYIFHSLLTKFIFIIFIFIFIIWLTFFTRPHNLH